MSGAWWNAEPFELEELEAELQAERDPITPELEAEKLPGQYGTIRCACGKLRLTFGGEVAGPCVHAA